MSKNIVENNLSAILDSLPGSPGVYQYFDKNSNLIYIGKAKNLKKRVKSYFNKTLDNYKTQVLVSKIFDIKYIEVNTESDALLLENNLIKKHQPKYNVLLKDDKTFPWICIKNEPFPRVFFTRNKINDQSFYFGPYTSVYMVKVLIDMIKQLFKLRDCNYYLSEENIQKNKFKVCLEFHIGNCDAPCVGKQSIEDYSNNIEGIKNILKGNIAIVKNYLKEKMINYAKEKKYEFAQLLKEKIEIIEKYQNKSVIVNPINTNIDVFSIVDDEKSAYVNFIKVVKGAVVQSQNIEIRKKLNESIEELLPISIIEIRTRLLSDSKEIIVPFKIDYKLSGVNFIIPKQGDKLKLFQLSLRNAKSYRNEMKRVREKVNPKKRIDRILEKIKKDLNLKELPVRIECFDNSNIQGSNPVAACVVFENAKPRKSEYRHFNIKSVVGPDDFASMEEVIYRRYKRLLEEKKELPQLIVIDGGKGQLNSAVKSLIKLDILDKIPIIGIAKKLEEIFVPREKLPIYIDKRSETLKIIQHIRDEAHRFGITFHKTKRSKDFIKTELQNIPGIGEKIIQNLLSEFKTVNNIKNSDIEKITKIAGEKKAKIIFEYFKLNVK